MIKREYRCLVSKETVFERNLENVIKLKAQGLLKQYFKEGLAVFNFNERFGTGKAYAGAKTPV